MTDETQEAEELLQQSSEQTLHDHDTTTSDETGDTPSLEDTVADAYAAIDDENENANEHVATRDRNLSALFMGLDQADELEALGEQAADALGQDDSTDTQAGALRLLVRYAIVDLDESLLESGKDGLKAYKKAKVEQETEQIDESDF